MNNLYTYSGTVKQAQHKAVKLKTKAKEQQVILLNMVREVRQIQYTC
jgi:hypothetical protein